MHLPPVTRAIRSRLAPLFAVLFCVLPTWADGIEGRFVVENKSITIRPVGDGYTGQITLDAQVFPFTARATEDGLAGDFIARGKAFPFVATLDGDTLVFQTGRARIWMQRERDEGAPANAEDQAEENRNPFDDDAGEGGDDTPAGIEGRWQDRQLHYDFKDGVITITERGNPGGDSVKNAYRLGGNGKMTVTIGEETLEIGYRIEGDRLILLLPNGGTEVLTRAAEPTGYNGSFAGTVEGKAATAVLTEFEGAVSGEVRIDGYRYAIRAQLAEGKATGTITDEQTQGEIRCELSLEDNRRLTITLITVEENPDQPRRVPLVFDRSDRLEDKGVTAEDQDTDQNADETRE